MMNIIVVCVFNANCFCCFISIHTCPARKEMVSRVRHNRVGQSEERDYVWKKVKSQPEED